MPPLVNARGDTTRGAALTPGDERRAEMRQGLRVAGFYAALFLVMGYPLPFHAGSMTLPGDPDTDLFMWTLGWNTHAVFNSPLSMFDANIYHPHPKTLAFSENLVGNTMFAAPVIWLTGNYVLALNMVGFASVVLCGTGAWLLARRLGAGPVAAVLAGLIFAYTPARFLRFGQLHLSTVQWVPFCLAFLHTYLDKGKRRDLRLAVGFFSLQVLTSGHGATFLTVAVVCVLLYRIGFGEPLALGRRIRDLGVTGGLLILPALLVLVPYRYVQLEFGLRRPLDLDWGPAAESFLASPSLFHLWLLSHFPDLPIVERASAWLFPGFLPLILAALALTWPVTEHRPEAARRGAWPIVATVLEIATIIAVAVGVWVALYGPIRLRAGDTLWLTARDPLRPWILAMSSLLLRAAIGRRAMWLGWLRGWGGRLRRTIRGARGSAVGCYGVLLLVTLLLAAGPPIGIWPWVYDLPGFNFIRVPSRFVILGTLALAVLAAFGFERVTRGLQPHRLRPVAAGLGALMLLEFLTIPLPAIKPVQVELPAVDRWLDVQPKPFVVAEVPTNTNERLQSTYMLHSMAHWQRTVNGHSGMRTPLHEELFSRLSSFPDEQSLSSLVELGVTYVVVHRSHYWDEEWPAVEAALKRYRDRLDLVFVSRRDRVYRVRPVPPGPDYVPLPAGR